MAHNPPEASLIQKSLERSAISIKRHGRQGGQPLLPGAKHFKTFINAYLGMLVSDHNHTQIHATFQGTTIYTFIHSRSENLVEDVQKIVFESMGLQPAPTSSHPEK